MITGELKRRIDTLWTEFWPGGITNPLTVIEQISFLMFARLLDITETRDENRMKRTGKPFQRRFSDDEQHSAGRTSDTCGADDHAAAGAGQGVSALPDGIQRAEPPSPST